jgi:hypothetical protein
MTGAGRCTYLDRINGELDYKGAARRIIGRGCGYETLQWDEEIENSLKTDREVDIEFIRRGQTLKIKLNIVEE